ncbi:MAG: TIGR04255 family protein [Gammaproteobacteria bacterium]|nr:MAG: TIGR04255 family protein [Gammaproteobacteria bacterium]
MSGSDIHETFPDAPILEALINFNVRFSRAVEVDRINSFHNECGSTFPISQDRVEIRHTVSFDEKSGSTDAQLTREFVGKVFFAEDRARAIQIRRDGFAYSKLRPYNDWNSLVEDAKIWWEKYRDFYNPILVTKASVRYINKIGLPRSILDANGNIVLSSLRNYILTTISIENRLSSIARDAFCRIVIPHPRETSILATVISTPDKNQNDQDKFYHILDIDVVADVEMDPINNDAIWNLMDALREFKNKIFFASLTEQAKELFK